MIALHSVLRSLARAPGFAAVAVLMLGLGIGLSTSTFSFANTFLLRELPYPDAGRLVRIFRTTSQSASRAHAPANLLDLRDAATSFSRIALYNDDNYAFGEEGRPAEQVGGLETTTEFFDVLGVHPTLGRGFAPGEDAPDGGSVVVITQRAWTLRFGSDPGVIDRVVRLNGQPRTIIGVLPSSFDAPLVWGDVEFIMPRVIDAGLRAQRSRAWMHCVARLKDGVTRGQAQSEIDTIAARLARQYPTENAGDGMRVTSLHDANMGGVIRGLMWLMTGVSLLMLLIACANLASLQVARALARTREYAVRSALGGNRRQMMVPLLLECLVLSLAGGTLGLVIASWTNDFFGSLLTIGGAPEFTIGIDTRVFAFAGVSSLLCAFTFGLTPALLASRTPTAEALKAGARSATSSRAHRRIKHLLVVTELSLAIVLVGAAGAFGVGARSFLRRELGWQPEGVLTGNIVLPSSRYNDYDVTRDFHRRLLERLAALPGVEHAALARRLPVTSLDGSGRTARLVVDGYDLPEEGREPTAEVGTVSPDFFATLRIPVTRGATFSAGLKANDPPVVIVNEAFARRFWPGEDPIGRRVRLRPDEAWLEVVGVVGDVRMATRLERAETPFQLYRPIIQAPTRYISVAVRSALPPENIASTVRQVLTDLDADLPLAQPGDLRAGIDRSFSNFNLVTANLGLSAAMGLFIATIGLFGVMSQLTVQRTRDFGVRLALGASAGSILGLVFREAGRMFVASVVLGVGLHLAMSVLLHRIMPEMPLPGPWLLAIDVTVLAATMLFATWLPAHRATRVDPLVALRCE
ncbi:MAG: ABC transporter permease [Opitutaceae bacterium]|nr:ABC transporter permease [Opitutaceae bacterium]